MELENNIKMGKVYLLKDGKIKDYYLTTNEAELKQICNKITGPTIYERDFISLEEKFITTNLEARTDEDDTQLYKKYLEQGYSVIRLTEMFQVSKDSYKRSNQQKLTCMLPVNIKKEDKKNICSVFSKEENNGTKKETYLKNFHIDELGVDYDYYPYWTCDRTNWIDSSLILDYFVREKTNELTNEEKIMFDKYRKFNLEEILTTDFKAIYPINHTDAGVIQISQDRTIASTLKKQLHGDEFSAISKVLHPKLKTDFSDLAQVVKSTSDILIQVSIGELLLWLPVEMNDYQREQLQNLMDEVRIIDRKNISSGKNVINIIGSVVDHMDDEYKGIAEMEELINPSYMNKEVKKI